jgi:diguanylate cyclase (GGDEF)-like protein
MVALRGGKSAPTIGRPIDAAPQQSQRRQSAPRLALPRPTTPPTLTLRQPASFSWKRIGGRLAVLAWLPPAALAMLAPYWWPGAEGMGLVAGAAALLLAVDQVRRTIDRQRALLAAMRRVADRDFSARVRDSGDDELAELAATFNQMTSRLGLKFATIDALSQIDQIILSKFEVDAVARLALTTARQIVGCDFVLLGLFEPGAGDGMRTFALRGNGDDSLFRHKFVLDPKMRALAAAAPSETWSENVPLPDTYFARPSAGVPRAAVFNVRPIARAGRTWGVLVLGNGRPLRLRTEQTDLLSGITDRLAVAFSTGERDRRLHLLAHRDPLTGLPNRNALLELLSQEIARAQRTHSRVAVLFLDLDRFKQTNDTLGHAVGDALLREAAVRIRNSVRGGDSVARHGGDEFTIVLGNLTSTSAASQVARQLIKALSMPFEIEGHTVYVGASVGIAVYPDDGADGADLLKKADTAMYRAKENGRSRLVYFEEEMNRVALQRHALYGDLRRALENQEFVLHYQPQIDLRTGQVCSVEALVRWHHPKHGLIKPAAFIPFAEENGLIEAIGTWVLSEACQQHARWRANGTPIPRISVNVSNLQLRRSNFIDTVKRLLRATQMPRGGLEIEVTESLIVEGGSSAIESMTTLADLGVLIAIDDFGVGYSSFGYLRTLPAQVLKLDRSFVIGIPQAPDATSITAAMITVAHTLRKEVVAEGVDSAAQLACLRRQGCDRVQGHLFCEAVPADQCAAFVHSIASHHAPPARVRQAPDIPRAASPVLPPVIPSLPTPVPTPAPTSARPATRRVAETAT